MPNINKSKTNPPVLKMESPPNRPSNPALVNVERSGRPIYRSEYKVKSLARSLSRGRLHPSPGEAPRPAIRYVLRNPPPPRAHSMHREKVSSSPTLTRKRAASGGHSRAVSPTISISSTSTKGSSNGSRRSLVIVPPKSGVLNAERSTVEEGTVHTNKPRIVSAARQLNISAPSPLRVRLSGVCGHPSVCCDL